MIKILIGGSPCTHWSIAQKNGRETKPEGLGWELFKNYLIAKEKFKPDFFIYENNKSAAEAIKSQIRTELGVWDGTFFTQDTGARYIEINSALVSAQNRQRFYVHNCGEVKQPADRGILLRDILEHGVVDRLKSYPLLTSHQGNARDYFKKQHAKIAFDPVRVPEYGVTDKARPVTASYAYKGDGEGSLASEAFTDNPSKQRRDYIAEPVRVGAMPRPNGELSTSQAFRIYDTNGKSVTINSVGGGAGGKTGLYAVPFELYDEYYKGGIDSSLIGMITDGEGKYRNGSQPSQQYRVYSCEGKSQVVNTIGNENYVIPVNVTEEGKSQTIKAQYHYTSVQNICCYSSTYGASGVAIPTQEEPQPFEGEGKDPIAMKRVYEVKDGLITIKGKQYPIKLPDGFYIIRKLTVTECCRLQTMPDDYCRAVCPTTAYKGLGNGWTAEVIIHILNGALANVPRDEEIVVLSMYDGIGTGRYCLDKMGFTNVKYYAYEIDEGAMKISMSNYPDIIQMGDAFQVRNEDWSLL